MSVGLVASVALAGAMADFLPGVTPWSPVTFGLPLSLFLGVALAAIAIPALRASRLDPVRTLRWG